MTRFAKITLFALACAACSRQHITVDAPAAKKPTAAPVVVTTVEQLQLPQMSRLTAAAAEDPDSPAGLTRLLEEGYGGSVEAPGQGPFTQTFPGDSPPPAGAKRNRLTRFAHLSDLQLADDESPARMTSLDTTSSTNGAYRAQEGFGCRFVNAAVHTINALDQTDAIDFVLLGGDNADNAQQNEEDWALALLDGGAVHCDSGEANDIITGPDNDQKDPFVAEGLNRPFYWMTGNHDVLMQGIFAVSDNLEAMATGDNPTLGTRDYSQPGAPTTTGTVPPDPDRHLLSRTELMSKVAADGDGHGIGPEQIARGKAFYTFDVAGTPLRFVVLDTACETGGDQGIIHRADVDGFVKPTLDQALSDHKWVVLASHHAIDALTLNGGEFGDNAPDAISGDDWVTFLSGYPNIVLSMVGHTHLHRVTSVQAGAFSFWEVMTSALADFPNQFRMVELWDEDNGWLTIRSTAVDYLLDDPLVAEGRQLALADFTSGWGYDGRTDASNANVILWVKKPF